MLARIPHPTYNHAVLMPYLDSNQCGVDEEGSDAFVIREYYEYEAQDASGYIYVGKEAAMCCCCDSRYHIDDMHETADGEMVCACSFSTPENCSVTTSKYKHGQS